MPVPNVDLREDNVLGSSALMKAIEGGHHEVVKLLLDGGASVDSCDNNGWTPLMITSQKGDGEIAQLLLEKHPSVAIQ